MAGVPAGLILLDMQLLTSLYQNGMRRITDLMTATRQFCVARSRFAKPRKHNTDQSNLGILKTINMILVDEMEIVGNIGSPSLFFWDFV